jgi:hypothetical protein
MVEASAAWPPRKIISGGQTGVDRGALDVAIELGIAHGGWCPKDRMAEDGRIPERYQLQEHASPHYDDRTRANVSGSDGTLILCRGAPRGGTQLTLREATRLGKPLLVVQLGDAPDFDVLRKWALAHRVSVLNVAGPRESQCPGIGEQAATYLRAALARKP